MIDVDGRVVSAAELVARIEHLIGPIATRPDTPVARPLTAGGVRPEEIIEQLAATVERVHPPNPPAERSANARLRWGFKRGLLKLVGWQHEPRWAAQRDFDAHVVHLATTIAAQLASFTHVTGDLRREQSRLDERSLATLDDLRVLGEELVSTTSALRQVADATAELDARTGTLSAGLLERADMASLERLRTEVARVHERLGTAAADGADVDYVEFEDRMRGSSEQVAALQADYVTKFPGPTEPGLVLDVGCGRGEMVGLLRAAGHEVLGIDTDRGMVAVCQERGLPVIEADAMRWLRDCEPGSLKGVFCAQVVEHLLTSELQSFIRLAHRGLRDHGVIVMETINPRSLFALGNHFFADTSHVRPVHPETLRFLCSQAGFSSVALVEVSRHEGADVPDDVPEGGVRDALSLLLSNVFGYQDYAIVATK